jgi:hypothetical protein
VVHDWPFEDGGLPPDTHVRRWLKLVESRFGTGRFRGSSDTSGSDDDKPTIAIHCVAGLGRAPLLVAIALIEFGNMAALDAIDYIRRQRRGGTF